MNRSSVKIRKYLLKPLNLPKLETGFSMLEAVVVVGVLLALAVSGFFSYGAITDNAKRAKVKSAASEIHTGVLVASMDGDANTKPQDVIDGWNGSTKVIRVEILEPSAGGVSANGDFCVQATNVENPTIIARTGSCENVNTPAPGADTDGDGIPDSSDPDIDGDGIPNAEDPTPNGASLPGNDTYVPGGVIPVGYTFGASYNLCPAPMAETLKARLIADMSEANFQSNYLYSIGDWDGGDVAWYEYAAADGVAQDLYYAMTPFQQRTFDNFNGWYGYTSDVPGYTDVSDAFWRSPTRENFQQMNEMIASAVPAFCGAVSSGAGTVKCSAAANEYLVFMNYYHHKYMFENHRYGVAPTQENWDAWSDALRSFDGTETYAQDNLRWNEVFNASRISPANFEIQRIVQMHKQELEASQAAFRADPSRSNFDIKIDWEYPLNGCR